MVDAEGNREAGLAFLAHLVVGDEGLVAARLTQDLHATHATVLSNDGML
jgi:hypothetical protein